MASQMFFKRYELKYKISDFQKREILKAFENKMQLDKYGRTTIRNLYFDTDNFRLIRRSIEKPFYKEKLRVRSYSLSSSDGEVFLELKKKYDSVVYKRRLTLKEKEVMDAFKFKSKLPVLSQIGDEIEYFRSYYKDLKPRVFLSYEREAYFALDKSDFRVTFDENILYRQDNLTLTADPYGTKVLEEGYSLMEIKTSGGIPMWLTEVLSRLKIYKTSFSKYGKAYEDILNKQKEEKGYARVV